MGRRVQWSGRAWCALVMLLHESEYDTGRAGAYGLSPDPEWAARVDHWHTEVDRASLQDLRTRVLAALHGRTVAKALKSEALRYRGRFGPATAREIEQRLRLRPKPTRCPTCGQIVRRTQRRRA